MHDGASAGERELGLVVTAGLANAGLALLRWADVLWLDLGDDQGIVEPRRWPSEGSAEELFKCVFEIDEPAKDVGYEIAQYRDLFRSNFEKALEAEHIPNAETRAEFLVGSLWGALSQIRLAGDTAAAKPMASVVIETIRSWTPS